MNNFDPVWLATALAGVSAVLAGFAALRPRIATDPALNNAIDDLARDLSTLRTALAEDLGRGRQESGAAARGLREEVGGHVGRLGDTLAGAFDRMGAAQGERLDDVSDQIRRLVQTNADANEALRRTVETRLEVLRSENATKLEEMRRTVDEKLQGTLEERLGETFRAVSEQLVHVHRSVGEMQVLATGVGDLKRVLTNVKSRGTWAEVSLGSLLDQALTPDQFARNVETVAGSGERVEYAVRLPGSGDGAPVWLPIDAKFPIEDYDRLVEASERADAAGIETASRGIETRIKQEGAKICRKYVSPPGTTDFAVLYLPTEGLYAEVLRRPGLVDHLQGECRIMVAGPTNLHALLTSLRVGFRTLAIEQRSGEVWRLLGAVKTEFGKYGDVLDAVKKKLNDASNHIDKASVRGRAIERRLRGVESLPDAEATTRLALAAAESDLLDAAE